MSETFAQDFRTAFGNIWAQIGILLGATAVFNFVARTLSIGLSELFRSLLNAYRALFHPIADFLLGWLPFELTDTTKDIAILWLAIGGAVARSLWSIYSSFTKIDGQYVKSPRLRGQAMIALVWGMQSHLWMRVAFPILTLVFWPFVTWALLSYPILGLSVDDHDSRSVVRLHRRKSTRLFEHTEKADLVARDLYRADSRSVMAMQIAATALCVAAMTLANAISSQQ